MQSIARFLIVLGILLVALGVAFLIFPKFPLFKLPGDFIIRKDNFVAVFPVATSILLSVILTLILNLLMRK